MGPDPEFLEKLDHDGIVNGEPMLNFLPDLVGIIWADTGLIFSFPPIHCWMAAEFS